MTIGTQLISIHAAARFLGINSDTLKTLVKADAVPHVVLPGDRIRFCPSDLAEFVNARKRRPAPEPTTV